MIRNMDRRDFIMAGMAAGALTALDVTAAVAQDAPAQAAGPPLREPVQVPTVAYAHPSPPRTASTSPALLPK